MPWHDGLLYTAERARGKVWDSGVSDTIFEKAFSILGKVIGNLGEESPFQ